MAKLRKKFNTKGFSYNVENQEATSGDYLYKSGVLTKDFKKTRFDSELEFSFFRNEIVHSDKVFDNKIKQYHDDRTIFFTEKSVCPTIRLESKYISDNSLSEVDFYNKLSILNTPNISPFYELYSSTDDQVDIIRFEQQTLTQTSKIYDRMLKSNYEKSKNVFFSESDDIVVNRNYNTITIDYNLNRNPNKDIYLSFSKRTLSRRVVFPDNTEFNTFNGNIVYLYNDDFITNQQGIGPYDYLGNISKDYKENINTFINDTHIAFNSFTMEYDSNIRQNDNYSSMYNNTILPIDNFGFPYSSKYKAEDRHLIPASKYITKPFVIEKIKIECLLSNKSFVKSPSTILSNSEQYTYPAPCLNFVNFFVINQKGSLNTSSINHSIENNYYDKDEATLSKITKNDYNFLGNATFTLNNRTNNQVFSTSDLFEMSSDNPNYINNGSIEGIDNYITKDANLRDLIGFVSIANYSSGGNESSEFVNTIQLEKNIDKFIDKSEDPKLDQNNLSECLYDNLPISIETNIKRYFENKNMPSFSRFRIYPTKNNYNRSNIELTNNRSLHNENANNTTSYTTLHDGVGRNINIRSEYAENCEYILMPDDKLFVGISLSNSAFTQEDLSNNSSLDDTSYQLLSDEISFGNDLVKISCTDDYPFKVHLIGYYLEDENKKVVKNKEIKNYKNTRKIGYGQNEVVDQIGSDLACLEQNYYDRTAAGIQGQFITKEINSSKNKTKLGNKFEIPNLNTGLYTNESFNTMSIIYNNLSFKKDYYKLLSSDSAVYVLKHYFDKYKFGMFANKLNHNRIHQFADSKYKNIKKRFMKGFYKQKTPGTVSAKLKFDFSKLNEFKGTNYLVSEIMSGADIKQGADYQLSFAIKDNLSQEVKIVYTSLPIGGTDSYEADYYDLNGNIYTCINTILKNKFELANGETYSDSINLAKREFLQKIVNGINEINLKTQTFNDGSRPTDFKIGITASIVESSMSTSFPEIKITLDKVGSLNGASISYNDINSGVIIEDFTLEEGDLLNSYNTTSSALYSDSDIIFKDR